MENEEKLNNDSSNNNNDSLNTNSDSLDNNYTSQEENQYSQKKEETKFCSKCGTKNSISNKFCSICGNNLKSIEDSIKETTNNLKSTIQNNETYQNFTNVNSNKSSKASWDNDDMINFIQKNTEFYIPKFQIMQDYDKSTSWNWASFFLTSNWFFYRKMYGIGVLIIVASFVISFIPFLGFPLAIALCVLCGVYGNTLYLKHIQKELESISNVKDDIKHRIILNKGGTNLWLPLTITFLVPILLSIIFAIFFSAAMVSYPFY